MGINVVFGGDDDMPEPLKKALAAMTGGDPTDGLPDPAEDNTTADEAIALLREGCAALDAKETFEPGDLVMPKPSLWLGRWPPGGVMVFRRYVTPALAPLSLEDVTNTHACDMIDCVVGWTSTSGSRAAAAQFSERTGRPIFSAPLVEFLADSRRMKAYVAEEAIASKTKDDVKEAKAGEQVVELLRKLSETPSSGRA